MTWLHLLLALLVWTTAGLALAPVVGGAIGRSARSHPLATPAPRDLPVRQRHLVSSRAA